MKKRGFWGIIAFLSSNVGVKDWCTRFHMRVMLKKVPFWNSTLAKTPSYRDIINFPMFTAPELFKMLHHKCSGTAMRRTQKAYE